MKKALKTERFYKTCSSERCLDKFRRFQSSSTVEFTGENVEIHAKGDVGANGFGTQNNSSGGKYTNTDVSTYKFDNSGDVNVNIEVLDDLDASKKSNAIGFHGNSYSHLVVTDNVNKFAISVTGSGTDGTGVGAANGTAALYTYGEVDIDAEQFAVTVVAGEKEGHAKSYGIHALNKADVQISSADFDVTVTDTVGSAIGIHAHNGAQVEATGSTITLNVDGADKDGWTTGVYARAETSANATSATKVVLGGANTTLVDIDVTNTAGEVQGIWASKYEQSGIESAKPAQIEVNGHAFELTVNGKGDALAVFAASKTDSTTPEANRSKIDVNTASTTIVVNSTDGEAHGIAAQSESIVNMTKGDVTIVANEGKGYAISARGNAEVNVGAVSKTVQLNGHILFDEDSTAGDVVDAKVNLVLDGANSWLKGNIFTDATKGQEVTGMNLSLSDGATWYATANSLTNYLAMDNGVVNVTGGTQDKTVTVTVEEANGSGTIALGDVYDFFKVTGTNNLTSVNVTQTGATADTMTIDAAINAADELLDNVDVGSDVQKTFVVAEGEVGGAIVVGANGAQQAVNAKTEALAEQVTLAPQMITRIMMNDVRKRMGDLRSAEGTHGVWARYNGGQMAGSGMEADFHMVQVGVDTVPVADAPRFGVAFSYAQTESDDVGGLSTTDMDSFSLAFYGTKMYDNGMFVDVIGRMATVDTEMNVLGNKAKMDNVALSLSGELGWRFDVTDRFFFEPSVEATYTYTNADMFTMGSGKYELEAVDSLVGRAGFAAGFKCPANKGDVYVRAAVVHEFMGDSTMNSWTASGNQVAPVVTDGKDTWFEYAIGAQFNVNKNTYVYADIERTEGATMDEDWRANVGVRFAF